MLTAAPVSTNPTPVSGDWPRGLVRVESSTASFCGDHDADLMSSLMTSLGSSRSIMSETDLLGLLARLRSELEAGPVLCRQKGLRGVPDDAAHGRAPGAQHVSLRTQSARAVPHARCAMRHTRRIGASHTATGKRSLLFAAGPVTPREAAATFASDSRYSRASAARVSSRLSPVDDAYAVSSERATRKNSLFTFTRFTRACAK
jgi:hypothetical protein